MLRLRQDCSCWTFTAPSVDKVYKLSVMTAVFQDGHPLTNSRWALCLRWPCIYTQFQFRFLQSWILTGTFNLVIFVFISTKNFCLTRDWSIDRQLISRPDVFQIVRLRILLQSSPIYFQTLCKNELYIRKDSLKKRKRQKKRKKKSKIRLSKNPAIIALSV